MRESNKPIEKAWKTIEKTNSAKLNPGDSVLLKRDNVWREQLIPQSGDETGYIKKMKFNLNKRIVGFRNLKKY